MYRKLLTIGLVFAMSMPVSAGTLLKNICRIKGQEPIVLRGTGVVIGLNGTGEANDPTTMRSIARALEIMGNPPTMNGQQGSPFDELRKMKNAALVVVTATIPPTGARRGEQLDCFVSALNGKSLVGGHLLAAAMQGTNTRDMTLYASCEGRVTVENDDQPTNGVISGGCHMAIDVYTPFYQNGCITLVLEENHANFQTASMIASEIRRKFGEYEVASDSQSTNIVRAVDATNIVVRIPQSYASDPVDFASSILDARIEEYEPEARVVINQRAGSIVISGDVEIGDVVISHSDIVVEADGGGTFSQIDLDQSSQPRLKQLVDQLNSLKVSTADMIDIIKGIERNGKLHGKLIVE